MHSVQSTQAGVPVLCHEARTGNGEGGVTEMLRVLVGCPDEEQETVTRPPAT